MANIPDFRLLRPEDFPELEWMPQFVQPLNRFMEEVTRALTKKLRINDNFEGLVRTVLVDGTYPVKFAWDFPNRPIAAWIGQAREISENHTTRVSSPISVYTTGAAAGGSATEALTATGLLSTDTVLSVTQRTPGANNLPLVGWSTLAKDSITGIWASDPGAGAVLDVQVKRGVSTALDLDWEFASNSNGSFFQINNIAGLAASNTNKFNVTVIAITG